MVDNADAAPQVAGRAGPRGLWWFLQVILNPGSVLAGVDGQVKAGHGLLISAMAFVVFFAQTSLDIAPRNVGLLAGLGALGLGVGTLGIGLMAFGVWVVTLPFGQSRSLGGTVGALGASYAPLLLYASLGLLCRVVLRWNTSIAFGATGMLWSIRPLISSIRNLTGDNVWVSTILGTVCGGLLMLVWVLIGQVI